MKTMRWEFERSRGNSDPMWRTAKKHTLYPLLLRIRRDRAE